MLYFCLQMWHVFLFTDVTWCISVCRCVMMYFCMHMWHVVFLFADVTCFQGFFSYPDMQPIMKHFCVYHLNAPGMQDGAMNLKPEYVAFLLLQTNTPYHVNSCTENCHNSILISKIVIPFFRLPLICMTCTQLHLRNVQEFFLLSLYTIWFQNYNWVFCIMESDHFKIKKVELATRPQN